MKSPLDKAKTHEVTWQNVSGIFDAMRGVEGANFLYFIGEQDNGPVKIGRAKDPISRLRGMQTGNPRRLRVERVLVGDHAAEKLLHEFWEPFVVTTSRKACAAPDTEWFRPDVREALFPIVDTAAARQIEFLLTAPDEINPCDLEQIIRDAHKEHDLVVQIRHQSRRLGVNGGYAVDRVSRV